MTEEEYLNWQAFTAGILFISSLKYLGVSPTPSLDEIQSKSVTPTTLIGSFALQFLTSYVKSSHFTYLLLLHRPFLLTLLQTAGLLLHASLHLPSLLLLRHILLTCTDLKAQQDRSVGNGVDDVIAAASVSMALIAFDRGESRLLNSSFNLPLLVLSLLPCYPAQLGERSLVLPVEELVWGYV